MPFGFTKTQIALAAVAAIGTVGLTTGPTIASAAKTAGKYVTGDFHNHTTCSDGSISMQKLVKKATDKTDTPWGLDWFVQAGHGGNGNRNCTLAEDATLATPVYPVTTLTPPAGQSNANITWENSGVTPKGDVSGTSPNRNMWRWQSVQEFQYPLIEYFNALKNLPLFLGIESVVAGHEHSSMSVITGQIPVALDTATLPTTPGPATMPYTPIGSGTALAKWEYCFDRGDTDTSRGNTVTGGTVGNNWTCADPDSAASVDPRSAGTQRRRRSFPPAAPAAAAAATRRRWKRSSTWRSSTPTRAITCRPTWSAPARSTRTGTTATTSRTCATSTTPRRSRRSASRRSRAMARRPREANTRRPQRHRRHQRRLRRRHDLRRHGRLRRPGRRRVGRAARRGPQLVLLRELRLAQPRLVRPRRPPLDARLLPGRIPAHLRHGQKRRRQALGRRASSTAFAPATPSRRAAS